MSYKLTTKSNQIQVVARPDKLVAQVIAEKLNISLARTGGQGSAGKHVVSATITEDDQLIFTMSDGTVISAGYVPNAASLAAVAFSGSLDDLNTGTLDEGIIIGGFYGN